jgi:hypothetical protein
MCMTNTGLDAAGSGGVAVRVAITLPRVTAHLRPHDESCFFACPY